eukprot:8441199-Alexandrium_andersonii.AAC.1
MSAVPFHALGGAQQPLLQPTSSAVLGGFGIACNASTWFPAPSGAFRRFLAKPDQRRPKRSESGGHSFDQFHVQGVSKQPSTTLH